MLTSWPCNRKILLCHAWTHTNTHTEFGIYWCTEQMFICFKKCLFFDVFFFFLKYITCLQTKLSCCFNFLFPFLKMYCIFKRLWMLFVYFVCSGVRSSVCLSWRVLVKWLSHSGLTFHSKFFLMYITSAATCIQLLFFLPPGGNPLLFLLCVWSNKYTYL